MIVTVNGTIVQLFEGARVMDALRTYYTEQGRLAPRPLPVVHDRYGNKVAHDGALREGSQLHIHESH